jgi:dicarboxylate transporter 10
MHDSLLGGAAASLAVTVTHPIDTLKVRFQIENELTGQKPNIVNLIRKTPILSYYQGLGAALVKQSLYTSLRFYIFEGSKNHIGVIPSAILAGAIGSFCLTPVDQTLIRQQSITPPPKFFTTFRILAQENRLWYASTIQTIRASCVTAGQFPTFQYLREKYPEETKSVWGHLGAGMISGTVAAALASPFDVVKSRVMSSGARGVNSYEGKSLLEMFRLTFEKDKLRVFTRGMLLTWMRLGPQSTLMLTFMGLLQEKLKK